MIRGLWSLARLDLLVWRRSPMAMVAALVPPLGMAVLLVVLTWSVGVQPVALVVEAHGPSALQMASIIESDQEAYSLHVTDLATAQRLLGDQEVAAVIVIPPSFDQMVVTHAAAVDVTINNVDIDFGDDIRRAVARSVAEFDAPQLGLQGELGGGHGVLVPNVYRVDIAETTLRTTDVSFLNYQVLPALVLLVLNVGLMGTAMLCARDVERRTARHLLLAPLPAGALVVGRIAGGIAASLLVLLPALAVCRALGVVDPPLDHWPALLALFLATGVCAAGIGAALGSVVRGTRTVSMAATVVATYLFFLGGGFTTIAFLPDWLRRLSSLVPTRYAIDGMRQALFYPGLDGVAGDLAALCLAGVVAAVVGALTLRRSWSAAG